MRPAMPIFGLGRASHLCKFGSNWLSLSRVIVSTNIFLWGRNPLFGGGGVHLTCDAHFWTRMSNTSQKSCMEIWFWWVEIGGMLILRGGGDPLLEGYMLPAMPIFELGRGCLDKSAPIGELLHLILKLFVLVRVRVFVRGPFGLSPR